VTIKRDASNLQTGSVSLTSPLPARTTPTEAEKFHLGYRPALDGLRGIAVLAVVATHSKLAIGWAGDIGVDIFFVLSGFLITSLLIEEWNTFHSISLRRFYARRALRLLPALMAVIAVFVIWHWVVNSRAVAARTALDGLNALFYSTNWMLALGLRQPVHVFAHTWTLSIEEQFYLSWPLLLILLLSRCGSRGSMLRWVVLGIFLFFIERVLITASVPSGLYNWLFYGTDARADAMLTGCAAAIALHSRSIPRNGKLRSVLKYSAWFIGIPGLVLIAIPAGSNSEFCAIGSHITTGLLAVLILVEVVTPEEGLLCSLLSRRWLVYVGKVSYGLYLWHYPIFIEVQTRKWPLQYELVVEFGLTAFATVVCFYLVERPALKLKRRFGSHNKKSGLKSLAPADTN
jgi:peptidoglycan/LPS O-acetylase OafA/YrhL